MALLVGNQGISGGQFIFRHPRSWASLWVWWPSWAVVMFWITGDRFIEYGYISDPLVAEAIERVTWTRKITWKLTMYLSKKEIPFGNHPSQVFMIRTWCNNLSNWLTDQIPVQPKLCLNGFCDPFTCVEEVESRRSRLWELQKQFNSMILDVNVLIKVNN